MGAALRANHSRRVTLFGASLEHAFHRCIDLASPYGVIRLLKPAHSDVREFLLELGDRRYQALRWTLKSVEGGTELSIARQSPMSWLTTLGRQSSTADLELDRKLSALAHILNMKIVVLGGGTGLYATLLGLRDRTSSLTAMISGLPRPAAARDPKDELGWLPRDDASTCLVALAPTVRENMVLRSLLGHRMAGGDFRGAHFGALLLQALAELRSSRQAALDEAVQLLGITGRVVLAFDADAADRGMAPLSASGLTAIKQADMVVLAPGHMKLDVLPVLSSPGILEALRTSHALKVVVTKIMSSQDDWSQPTTSHQVRQLADIAPNPMDVVLANSAQFRHQQLRAYAAEKARPLVPDVEETAKYAKRVVTERLAASGDLARHDPRRLGECLIEIGTASLLGSSAWSRLDESLTSIR